MTNKEKALIIGAIDDLLINHLNYFDTFSEDEKDVIAKWYEESFDTTSPKDLRKGMSALARKLYEELRDSE